MNYDLNELENKLNKIETRNEELNEELKQTIDHVADIDESNVTRELKYSMYEGAERLYQIENDKYKDLIGQFSFEYLELTEFYVGPELPRKEFNDNFKNNLIGMYMLFFWIIANYDNLEKTRIVLEEYDVD